MIFSEVNPEKFISVDGGTPATGRGAWVRDGIGFDYRYMINPVDKTRIGTVAEKSLSHWAVAAGTWAIQQRLTELHILERLDDSETGIFGAKTRSAVMSFQARNIDPQNSRQLDVDGIVGTSDARSLFTPSIRSAEMEYDIPETYLLGEVHHESLMDPGAVGYYIFYPDYRGVDRALCQINSRANPQVTWQQAFDHGFSLNWSAKRLRTAFDSFRETYPKKSEDLLWDCALCNHNNPSAARAWAKAGYAPTEQAAKYVAATKAARY